MCNHFTLVSERLFGMLLQGYVNTIQAYSLKSEDRGIKGDVRFQVSLISTTPVLKRRRY